MRGGTPSRWSKDQLAQARHASLAWQQSTVIMRIAGCWLLLRLVSPFVLSWSSIQTHGSRRPGRTKSIRTQTRWCDTRKLKKWFWAICSLLLTRSSPISVYCRTIVCCPYMRGRRVAFWSLYSSSAYFFRHHSEKGQLERRYGQRYQGMGLLWLPSQIRTAGP